MTKRERDYLFAKKIEKRIKHIEQMQKDFLTTMFEVNMCGYKVDADFSIYTARALSSEELVNIKQGNLIKTPNTNGTEKHH